MDSAALAATALDLLRENGQSINIIRGTTPGNDYDPLTGKGTALPSETATPSVGVMLAITTAYASRIGQEQIQKQDRLMILPGDSGIGMKDVIEFSNGARWQVVNVEELAPAGEPIIYTIQVRP